ncbi:hypothetical protein [Shewanella halifaxensis]|uniref:hypothetical protein n=1 Tax=Shewanella halifaxensis TaxID=271098 RepID=UPI000D59185A|nr:hypothetical protein [Shewanella halifaxensis]
MKNHIYALALSFYLLINPTVAAEIVTTTNIDNIQFHNDNAENLLIISNPNSPTSYTPENTTHITSLFRNISKISEQRQRIKETADLLASLSKKYQLSTQPNWKDHVIKIKYTTEPSGSLHRLSKGLNRKDFDILLKKFLKDKTTSNNNRPKNASSHSDKPKLEDEDDEENEVDEYAEWLEDYMEEMSDEFYNDEWYVNGIDHDGDGEDDEVCGYTIMLTVVVTTNFFAGHNPPYFQLCWVSVIH